jgi:hypothetical protein
MPEFQKIELDKVYAAMDAYVAANGNATTTDMATTDMATTDTATTDMATTDMATTDMATTDMESSSSSSSSGEGEASAQPPMLCVVLATDGVWDNWVYPDVTRFVLDSTCIKAVSDGSDGAQRVALSFMQRNAFYSKKNFGRSADNATGIVMYLTRK